MVNLNPKYYNLKKLIYKQENIHHYLSQLIIKIITYRLRSLKAIKMYCSNFKYRIEVMMYRIIEDLLIRIVINNLNLHHNNKHQFIQVKIV